MDTVIKTALVYLFLLVVLRLAGRRTLGQMTSFDLVVVLIIGGTVQRALLGQDYSVTNALVVVTTLVLVDVVFSLIERESRLFSKIVNGVPMIIVEDGHFLQRRLRRSRLSEEEILSAARAVHGIERIEDIKFAILEATGHISIIPYTPRPTAPVSRAA
jgi:uncharacterized membrane protein YcaP (DUF421 family)